MESHSQVEQVSDVIKLRGCLEIALRDVHGNELNRQKIENTICTAGRRWVLENIYSGGAASIQVIGWMAVGTHTAAPATGNTGLGGETTRIAIGTFTTSNVSSTTPSMRFEASFATDEANTTLAEVGLFNTSTAEAATMLGRATFGTINKTSTNTLSISYTVSN